MTAEVKVSVPSTSPSVTLSLPPTQTGNLSIPPSSSSRVIAVENRPSRANAKHALAVHPLGERMSPIVSRFVKELSGGPDTFDGPAYQDALKELENRFEEVYSVFKNAREVETEREFDQFMQEFVCTLIQNQPVKDYLKDRNISISVHSNQHPQCARIRGQAPRIGIRVGDFVQSADVEKEINCFSDLMHVKRNEDTPLKFDATIWIADPDDSTNETKKTNIVFRLLRWLFFTKSGRIVTSLFLGSAFFGGLGGGLDANQGASQPLSTNTVNQSDMITSS